MSSFKQIDSKGAQQLLNEDNAVMVDIRDMGSFATSHAASARHLTNDNIVEFMNEIDYQQPVLVMCYHGVSSQGAAEYLVNQGYEDVYSVIGGFSAWHTAGLPTERG
ncbi:thiosulfate sulfurtransferase GlpE [Vibrio sp. MACH09]|uniref:thiosulfate sulfurtransferase GlpE n=1 Tax=Vibrio sp. MACH09 TaxID=3025122 RepID=UPI002792391C|nr:thiosulfate sulfurtransferase GlpE [Vibrio sp. MACH09]GLO62280.1 thiosulfate sulfurtransferase GlpE [Vibrio sp. MACH09]